MNKGSRGAEVPVLLLHNQDPAWPEADRVAARDAAAQLRAGLEAAGHPVEDVEIFRPSLYPLLEPYHADDFIVFNWCEELPGLPHSDILIAQILEEMNFSYTGSPPEVLELSWDKPRVKKLLARGALPTPVWQLYESGDIDGWNRYPAIVKPAGEHSSTGITEEAVVLNENELRRRVAYVIGAFHQQALVEDFIDGREFHVSLCGNGAVTMLPPAEMDFGAFKNVRDRLCTYDSKFKPGSTHYEGIKLRLPASLSDSQYALLKRTAVHAYRLTGCRDYARIDLRLRDGCFYVLDVNPNADISPDTSLAIAAETAGYSYGAFGSLLVNFAARRHPVFSRIYR